MRALGKCYLYVYFIHPINESNLEIVFTPVLIMMMLIVIVMSLWSCSGGDVVMVVMVTFFYGKGSSRAKINEKIPQITNCPYIRMYLFFTAKETAEGHGTKEQQKLPPGVAPTKATRTRKRLYEWLRDLGQFRVERLEGFGPHSSTMSR